jgi:HEAT repeat protein
MNQQERTKYARRLRSRFPLLGRWLRRSACRKLAADLSASTVPYLVEALRIDDAEVRSIAAMALRLLKDAGAIDALCELAITDPTAMVANIVKERDFQPQSVSRRCVLFLLTGQLERYFDLDFEFQHLRAEYQAGDERLRQRIGDVVRRSGDSRLIGLFRASRQRKLASELTEREAAIVIEVHARNQQWAEIFALLFHIPLSSTIAALDVLGKSGWRPQNEVEVALLDALLRIRSCIDQISEKPPASDVILGPVLAKWIARGHSPELRGQAPDTLRKTLHQGAPPEAVAALAALVVNGQNTPDDMEATRTHKHWLVRLVYLERCGIAAQFAFSDMPTGSDGGGLWIERLWPAVLNAAIYRWRAVSLTPDQITALQSALDGVHSDTAGRRACGRLLESLARHHLRHTIEVDEQMMVEVGETEIEIEG